MTEHLKLAIRRYEQIVPNVVTDWFDVPRSELKAWLENDVCKAIELYWRRPKFRQFAAWPLTTLRAADKTPERRLVKEVDQSLVKCADVLLRLAESPPVREQLVLQNLPQLNQIHEEAVVGSTASCRSGSPQEPFDAFALLWNQIKEISDQFWTDLVCPEDYLHPIGGWMRRKRGDNAQPAEFVLLFNPSLIVIGDFVTRCLIKRVEVLFKELEDFRGKCLAALSSSRRRYPAQLPRVEQAWDTLDTAFSNLRTMLSTGEQARLRDSCVILAQVYLAFRPAPEFAWLGLREKVIAHGQLSIRRGFAASSNAEIFERIKAALSDLAHLYEGDAPGQSAIEEAIGGGGLVLTDEPAAYWEGKPIKAAWRKHRVPWALLYQMAVKAPTSGSVGERDIYKEVKSDSTMATARQRLRDLLPRTLKGKIVPGSANRTYRLNLDHDQVQVFATAPNLQ